MYLVGGFASPWPGVITSSGPTGIPKEAKEVFMAIIQLKGFEVLIDDEDLHLFKSKITVVSHGRYAQVRHNGKSEYIHRVIVSCPSGLHVDHINGNGLDNRRRNLRVCSRSENLANSKKPVTNKSGFKGVYWNKQNNKWRALIQHHGIKESLGSFDFPADAHEAYCEAARKYFGEFARLE